MDVVSQRGLRARAHRAGSSDDAPVARPTPSVGVLRRAIPVLFVPFLLVGMSDVVGDAVVPTPSPLVVSTLDTELSLDVNERVDYWRGRFRTDQRWAFQRLLERKGVFEDLIRDQLRARGMPEELVYVSMLEGGFVPHATSSASAVGLWQFMGPTAQQYGLRVGEWVDERRDPVRATGAALDYLRWLHQRYGSWYLALAAYNSGPGRVDRVLRRHADGRTGADSLYWEVAPYLPLETREYVPRLVAATLLAENAEAEGFEVEEESAYRFDRVFVPGGTTLARVARALGVGTSVLRELNPHLIRGATPPAETYPIRVPEGTSAAVVASIATRRRAR
jgi:membrane-bound lytic murein transglycosylase D